MSKLSQFDDINALLVKAEKMLLTIEEQYTDSLNRQELSFELLVEIKDYLGNLRSSLDYLRSKISKHNFPICKTEKEFENATTDLSILMRETLKKWQPFNNNNWLAWFNVLNNKSKHITLIPQKKIEIVQTRVTHPQGGMVTWGPGVTFGSGVSVLGVPIDPYTQLPIANNIVKTERIVWIDFIFDNQEVPGLPDSISALPFLKLCFENIVKIIRDMEPIISSGTHES